MSRKQPERKHVDLAGARVLVAGATGFLGTYVSAALTHAGAEVVPLTRGKGYDLRNEAEALQAVMVGQPDMIVDVAGPSGGIAHLAAKPAAAFRDTMLIGMNLIHAAALAGIRLITVGTPASYPDLGTTLKEASFWGGASHYMVASHGIARKALLTMMVAYRAQHRLRYMYLVPATVYGPGDKFAGNRASSIAALIRRFIVAVEDQDDQVVCWGSPDVVRSYVFAPDFARGVVMACSMEQDYHDVVNLSGGPETTLGKLAEFIGKETGFEGKIIWDPEKPVGAPRRVLDGKLAKKILGWEPRTSLEDGIKATIAWFKKTKPED